MKIFKIKNTILRLNKGIHAIVNPDLEIEITLNDTALLIWKMIDNYETAENILPELIRIYDADPNELKNDFEELIFDLLIQGMIKVDRDSVFLPYSFWKINNSYAVYFATERIALLANKVFIDCLKGATAHNFTDLKKIKIEDNFKSILNELKILNTPYHKTAYRDFLYRIPKSVTIMPTTHCNLNCVYCYAAKNGKKKYFLTKQTARASIDYVVQNSFNLGNPRVDVSFMGGGEPTVNWEVLRDAVAYAREIAKKRNLPLSATLTTNGFLENSQIDWISENFDLIKVSFDGIKDIQNKQRPAVTGDSFNKVSNTLKMLTQAKANFLVRITVTNDAIGKLNDSINHVLNNYSPNSIIINPVYVCGNCESHGVTSIKYEKLFKKVNNVQDAGSNFGVDIVFPYDKVTYLDVPKTPFCGFRKGNMFVTPDGYLSACSEIDNAEDKRATIFFFGKWDKTRQSFKIDDMKLSQLYQIEDAGDDHCRLCNSNPFCGSHCLVRKLNEKTIHELNELRRHKQVINKFSRHELNILRSGNQSKEGKLQCAMTNWMSRSQIVRALYKGTRLKGLSVKFNEVKLKNTQANNKYKIHKIIKLTTKD